MSYHINPTTGATGSCSAKPGNCPFGGEDMHHATPSQARTAYENMMQASFIGSIMGVSKDTAPKLQRKTGFQGQSEIRAMVEAGELSTPQEAVTFLEKKYPEIELLNFAKSHGGYMVLDGVRFAKDKQKQGLGTQFMEDLCLIADENKWPMALTPSLGWGATSVDRLTRFYRRFGFVPNKGRNKDFVTMEGMLRKPAP